MKFELHESSYLGGDYYLGSAPNVERVTVQDNFADEEGVLAEPDFPEYRTLIYLTQRAESDPTGDLDEPGLTTLRVEEI